MLKDDIILHEKSRGLVSIFDSTRNLKLQNMFDLSHKQPRPFTNNDTVLQNLDYTSGNESINEEDYYNNKITKIINEIIKHRILIKLKKNIMSLVDGKIILFSDLIKVMCSYNSFNYRITLDELDRDNLEKILDYLDIIEWNKSKYMWENKDDELNKWFKGIEKMVELEEVLYFFKFKIKNYFFYFIYFEFIIII